MDNESKKDINKYGVKVDENNIIDFLQDCYPNKLINNVTDIYRKKRKVYLYINKYCKEHNITNIYYLEKKGFKILSNEVLKNNNGNLLSASLVVTKELRQNKYNLKIIKRLIEEYNCNKTEMAIWLGVSRQLLDQQLSKEIFEDNFIGDDEYFENEIEEKIISVIKSLKIEYRSKCLEIKIYFSFKNNDIAIFYKYNNDIKCIFNPQRLIGKALKENKYTIYNNYDLEILKNIKEGKGIRYIRKWDGNNSKFIFIDNGIKSIIAKNSRIRNMTKKSYIEFLDINLYTSIDEIEDRLYVILKKSITEDGIVKIENRLKNGKINLEYINLYRDLKKLNISLKELAEKFGFNYKRIVNKQE